MVHIPEDNFIEISLGTYAINLTTGYVTSILVKKSPQSSELCQPINQYHAQYRKIPGVVCAYIFDQVTAPGTEEINMVHFIHAGLSRFQIFLVRIYQRGHKL